MSVEEEKNEVDGKKQQDPSAEDDMSGGSDKNPQNDNSDSQNPYPLSKVQLYYGIPLTILTIVVTVQLFTYGLKPQNHQIINRHEKRDEQTIADSLKILYLRLSDTLTDSLNDSLHHLSNQ
ncbi:MAG: hypothetical protein JW795_11310 [Chitinivibrionales bacterium]|nr:hypothetical protein [Chitinivibrionales bacterium]